MGTDTSGHNSIAIIGAGHMGSALIEGFIKAGIPPHYIIAANKSPQKLNKLRSLFKIRTTTSNKKAAASTRFIFLTVKPAIIPAALKELTGILAGKVIISAAAGLPIQSLKQHISDGEVVVARIMPNLPVASCSGIIGYYAEARKNDDALNDVKVLLNKLGLLVPASFEAQLDSLTLITGCGPAIIAYFMELLETTGKSILNDVDMNTIIYKLFIGTHQYMQDHQISATDLKIKVATKGGITEQILHSLDLGGVPKIFQSAIDNGKNTLSKLKQAKLRKNP